MTHREERVESARCCCSEVTANLKKRGQAKFTGATGWVLLDSSGIEGWDYPRTEVRDGRAHNKDCYCSVGGKIHERADGRIKVLLDGWGPGYTKVSVSLRDEPGRREIAAVEELKTEQGPPYVAVLIVPPLP